MDVDKNVNAEELEMLRWYMRQVEKEIWELDGQGRIDQTNIAPILQHLVAAWRYCRDAKWRSVEHLKAD